MKNLIKIPAIILGTVLFLCITINDKPLFSYIYGAISPATRGTQALTVSLVGSAFDATKKYSQKLFDNSVPRKDYLKVKLSSPGRSLSGTPLEHIEVKDKEELDDLIKSH